MSEAFLRIHILAAGHGDSIQIEYGNAANPSRILVDGGPPAHAQALAANLHSLNRTPSHELVVITHVDSDHIGGIVPILADANLSRHFSEIWFNDWTLDSLENGVEEFGFGQGDSLSKSIRTHCIPWNTAFSNGPITSGDHGPLPTCTLPGGATISVLAPRKEQLRRLFRKWKADNAKQQPEDKAAISTGVEVLGASVSDLASRRFVEDRAAPNGSSIAMLFEYMGKRILLGGDSPPSALLPSIARFSDKAALQVDVFVIPHHGSSRSVSDDLVRAVKAKYYVFSSDGAVHGHPSEEAVARVIQHGPRGSILAFNTRSPFNSRWETRSAAQGHETLYGDAASGLMLEL